MNIGTLRNLTDMIPMHRDTYPEWTIRVFNREQQDCSNYLSPSRRDFYKILLITKGAGVFTMGLHTYYIEEPTLLFIHPNDIISWRNLSTEAAGYYVLFKKDFIHQHLQLRSVIEKFGLFTQKEKSVIRLGESEVPRINECFERMKEEELTGNAFKEDIMQALLQLLMAESMKVAQHPKPDEVSGDYRHIHQFFELLEKETAGINFTTPIRVRTAKEFAGIMHLHPNYLNALLKKHTGENASTHIRNRLLDEAKILLRQTNWSLQDISYSIGFADQPGFNLFFKKNTGFTPAEFRKK
jgi:AraC-like DNA-binding protein